MLSACGEQPAEEVTDPDFNAPPLPDFSTYQDVDQKKQAFFAYLLPLVEEANNRVLEERKLVLKWTNGEALSKKEKKRIQAFLEKYRVKADTEAGKKELLLHRVNVIPPSLVLAQAANESAWGTSRFATEGNNLFGQWCFSQGCGLVPTDRIEGAAHEVRRFDSPLDSVESYILNLNRHTRYRQLRLMRHKLSEEKGWVSGTELAGGLIGYSERGQAYVNEIRHMIQYNDLEQYDRPQADQSLTGE